MHQYIRYVPFFMLICLLNPLWLTALINPCCLNRKQTYTSSCRLYILRYVYPCKWLSSSTRAKGQGPRLVNLTICLHTQYSKVVIPHDGKEVIPHDGLVEINWYSKWYPIAINCTNHTINLSHVLWTQYPIMKMQKKCTISYLPTMPMGIPWYSIKTHLITIKPQ